MLLATAFGKMVTYINPNLGGLFRDSFWGWENYFLSKTCYHYARNLKFGS